MKLRIEKGNVSLIIIIIPQVKIYILLLFLFQLTWLSMKFCMVGEHIFCIFLIRAPLEAKGYSSCNLKKAFIGINSWLIDSVIWTTFAGVVQSLQLVLPSTNSSKILGFFILYTRQIFPLQKTGDFQIKKKIGTCPMLGAYTSVVAVCYICVLVWQKWSHIISCLNVFTFFHDGAVIADYMVCILLLWKTLQFGSHMYTIYSKVFTCHIAICTQKCSVEVLGYEKWQS